MKNSLLIFLSCCILANALPKEYVDAIFKIDHLFEHYKHHQEEENDHDFLDFLKEHYFSEHHEDHHQDHEKLPFHNHNAQSPLQIALFLLPEMQNIIAFSATKNFIEKKQLSTFYQSWFSFQNNTFIWQPPETHSALYSPC